MVKCLQYAAYQPVECFNRSDHYDISLNYPTHSFSIFLFDTLISYVDFMENSAPHHSLFDLKLSKVCVCACLFIIEEILYK